MKIKSIHKDDAYYPYRKQLIGLELVKSRTELVASTIKNYKAGYVTTRKEVDILYPSRRFYFLAVKVED